MVSKDWNSLKCLRNTAVSDRPKYVTSYQKAMPSTPLFFFPPHFSLTPWTQTNIVLYFKKEDLDLGALKILSFQTHWRYKKKLTKT